MSEIKTFEESIKGASKYSNFIKKDQKENKECNIIYNERFIKHQNELITKQNVRIKQLEKTNSILKKQVQAQTSKKSVNKSTNTTNDK